MRDYHDYVATLTGALDEAVGLPLAAARPLEHPAPAQDAPRVVLFSPHPDDEIIVGGLALRLMRECGYRVINVAVTLGSNKSRQLAREDELVAACRYIGFDSGSGEQCGLEKINLSARRDDPIRWLHAVDVTAELIRRIQPLALFYPHASDANTTHMGVHGLVNHALLRLGPGFSCASFETEFWSPMDTPNLMVESSARDVGDLVTALSFHVGEVSRNPYHLTLPAWMIDNVRRGAERIAGQGRSAPRFRFATLYRQRRWTGERFQEVDERRFVGLSDKPAELLS